MQEIGPWIAQATRVCECRRALSVGGYEERRKKERRESERGKKEKEYLTIYNNINE